MLGSVLLESDQGLREQPVFESVALVVPGQKEGLERIYTYIYIYTLIPDLLPKPLEARRPPAATPLGNTYLNWQNLRRFKKISFVFSDEF